MKWLQVLAVCVPLFVVATIVLRESVRSALHFRPTLWHSGVTLLIMAAATAAVHFGMRTWLLHINGPVNADGRVFWETWHSWMALHFIILGASFRGSFNATLHIYILMLVFGLVVALCWLWITTSW